MREGIAFEEFLAKIAELSRESYISLSKMALVIGVAVAAGSHIVLTWQAGHISGTQALVVVVTLVVAEIAAVRNLQHFQGLDFLILLAVPLTIWVAVGILDRVHIGSQRGVDIRRRMRQYQAVLKRDPRNVAAHVFLGDSYSRLGKRREAAAEYRAALRLAPHEYEAKFKLERLQRA